MDFSVLWMVWWKVTGFPALSSRLKIGSCNIIHELSKKTIKT
jgi:hypothetical protein